MLTAVQNATAGEDLTSQASTDFRPDLSASAPGSAKNISISSINAFITEINPGIIPDGTTAANPLDPFAVILGSAIQRLFNMVSQLITAFSSQKDPPTSQPALTPTDSAATQSTTPPPTQEEPAPAESEINLAGPDEPGPAEQTAAVSRPLKKSGEFLWKPVSEKDGNLVILCRSAHTGKIASVKVLDPKTQKVLAKGKPSGVANGNREHFRFDKPGSAFPDGVIVEITLKNGEKRTQVIKETSARFTR